ncbi:hypothetical protein VTK73DRAFT_3566 [Phialemonium thermophilum]|uniref:Uncharacterized protein n=1 Tax=Phialemonium thermophilum TaxID=223376 RepID=A0ABR3VHG0_9PEZI
MSTPLQSLVHSSLGIHSLLSKHPLKHNVIDRDKIVVPPNWDSWGKIRVLREGFDVEQISNGWSIDIGQPLPPSRAGGGTAEDGTEQEDAGADPEGSIVPLYEAAVHDPSLDALQLAGRDTHSTKLEVETTDTQTFLAEQLRYLESFRQKMEGTAREASRTKTTPRKTDAEEGDFAVGRAAAGEGRLNDHIGPVQFNVGGIQVDADDIVQRLKDRQVYGSSPEPASPEADHAIEDPRDTDTMQAFFNQLMKRGGHRTERLAGQGKAGDT